MFFMSATSLFYHVFLPCSLRFHVRCVFMFAAFSCPLCLLIHFLIYKAKLKTPYKANGRCFINELYQKPKGGCAVFIFECRGVHPAMAIENVPSPTSLYRLRLTISSSTSPYRFRAILLYTIETSWRHNRNNDKSRTQKAEAKSRTQKAEAKSKPKSKTT